MLPYVIVSIVTTHIGTCMAEAPHNARLILKKWLLFNKVKPMMVEVVTFFVRRHLFNVCGRRLGCKQSRDLRSLSARESPQDRGVYALFFWVE